MLPVLFGCGGPDRLMPLSVGQKWDYRYRWGVEREMGQLKVVREVPVANGTGWELKGPRGVVRLGYVGDQLVADQLGGAFLTPALPIGIRVKSRALWRGWLVSAAGKRPAKATVVASEATLKVRGRRQRLNRTVVTLRTGDHTIELATWYAPGDGIVQQEQRTDDKLDLALERVSGGS